RYSVARDIDKASAAIETFPSYFINSRLILSFSNSSVKRNDSLISVKVIGFNTDICSNNFSLVGLSSRYKISQRSNALNNSRTFPLQSAFVKTSSNCACQVGNQLFPLNNIESYVLYPLFYPVMEVLLLETHINDKINLP